ncbi:MAG: hypothetical protein AAFY20_18620 [Cyanobacteria bacterium J06639_14]
MQALSQTLPEFAGTRRRKLIRWWQGAGWQGGRATGWQGGRVAGWLGGWERGGISAAGYWY